MHIFDDGLTRALSLIYVGTFSIVTIQNTRTFRKHVSSSSGTLTLLRFIVVLLSLFGQIALAYRNLVRGRFQQLTFAFFTH
jgi:hypothetical protein